MASGPLFNLGCLGVLRGVAGAGTPGGTHALGEEGPRPRLPLRMGLSWSVSCRVVSGARGE